MDNIEIADYKIEYHDAFVALSVAWITEHWELEANDLDELNNAGERILGRGGFILIALYNGKPVGTCAMIPMDGEKYDYELAKFTTSSEVRGKGIGKMLAFSALDRAAKSGKNRIYLETNQLCKAAIHIYESVGFKHLPGKSKVFERGDVLMECIVSASK